MALLTRTEFEVLFDIHYGFIEPGDEPDYYVIRSLQEKGLIILNYDEGQVFEYVETVYSLDLFKDGEYDDWETELRYKRSLKKKEK